MYVARRGGQMTDIQKIIIACILTMMGTFTVTITGGYLLIIKNQACIEAEQGAQRSKIETLSSVLWPKVNILEDKVAKLEAKWEYLERGE